MITEKMATRSGLPRSDFRQGRKVPRNVYHGDEPLFVAATEELAVELVTILNAGADVTRATLDIRARIDAAGGLRSHLIAQIADRHALTPGQASYHADALLRGPLTPLLVRVASAEILYAQLKAEVDEADLARDEAGFLGTVPACIRALKLAIDRLTQEQADRVSQELAISAERRLDGVDLSHIDKLTTDLRNRLEFTLDRVARYQGVTRQELIQNTRNVILNGVKSGNVETDDELWEMIDTAPMDGTPVWAISLRAQNPTPRVSWYEDGWQRVASSEKFVGAGPHRWSPTHWMPLKSPSTRPMRDLEPS